MGARRQLAEVLAALEHATARERAVATDRARGLEVSVAEIQIAILRAHAAQLRLLIAQSERGHRLLEESSVAVDMFSDS